MCGRGACVVGGMHGRGACMAGDVHGGGVHGGGVHGRGGGWAFMTEETAPAVDGTHPTGMHSCMTYFYRAGGHYSIVPSGSTIASGSDTTRAKALSLSSVTKVHLK